MLVHVLQTMLLSAVVAGCAQPVNPSFAVSEREARTALKEMRRDRKPQARPVVILGGYTDPGVGTTALAGQLRGVFEEPVQMVTVSYPLNLSFDACRRDVIAAVGKRWPSAHARETVEVDVVAMSMGGL